MTEQQHPITPARELVEKWATSSPIQYSDESWAYELFIAHQAARWGADHELDACCKQVAEWQEHWECKDERLRAARRPKPPSLKEQALSEVAAAVAGGNITPERGAKIRLALEQLND
jgi:hypothetical protein